MANYYGTARSNYFHVNDPAAFKQWAASRGLEVLTKQSEPEMFGITPGNGADSGDWPSYEMETDEEMDLPVELSKHLRKGEVAVLMEAGAEKLRYVTGVALAVDHAGQVVSLSLNDIYEKAAEAFGVPKNHITQATY